jgi:hypothetical protein
VGAWAETGWPYPVRRMPDAERERLRRTLLELWKRGLSTRAISIVFSLYEGVDLSAPQVRRWLKFNGVAS